MKQTIFSSWTNVGVIAIAMLFLVACGKDSSTSSARRSGGNTSASLQAIHFDYDRSEVKAEHRDEMQGNAAWMNTNSGRNVTVEGHADERGTSEYNIALGQRRASSAKNYLVNLGISSSRLRTISYGEEKPAAMCHSENCWWQNRRAEFRK
jgi:peptidoglycan-associated lipoprotein